MQSTLCHNMAAAISYLITARNKCNQNPFILSGSSYFSIGGNPRNSLHVNSTALADLPYASVFKKPEASTWYIIKQTNGKSQNIQVSVSGVQVTNSNPYRMEVGDWIRLGNKDKKGHVDILFTNDPSHDVIAMTAEQIDRTWKIDENRMVEDEVAKGLPIDVDTSCSQCAVFSFVSGHHVICNYCFKKSLCRPLNKYLKPTASLVLLNEDVFVTPFMICTKFNEVSVSGSCKVGSKIAKKLNQDDLEGLYLDITVKGWFVRSLPGVTLNGSPIMLNDAYYHLTMHDNIVFVGNDFRFYFQPDDLSDIISKLKLVNRVVTLQNDLCLINIELEGQRVNNDRLLAELKEKRSSRITSLKTKKINSRH